MDPNIHLQKDVGEVYSDPSQYRRLIGILLYLNIARPNISYDVQSLSQFMSNPCVPHFEAICCLI